MITLFKRYLPEYNGDLLDKVIHNIDLLSRSEKIGHQLDFLNLLFYKSLNMIRHQQDMSSCETLIRPIESSIKEKLEAALKPLHCEVINESYMHNVPKNSETHFKVVVVAETFDKQPLIKRHRMINQLLQAELQGGVHALSIIAKTPEQWEVSNKTVAASPACRGGFGK